MTDAPTSTTEDRPRCRYPYICGQEFCDCNLTPEDIEIMDENVRQISPSLLRDDLR